VDLGTAAGKNKNTKTEGREMGHRSDQVQIDDMRKKYEAAVQKHEIAIKSVQETQVELDRYGDLLKQLEAAHEHSVSAERERNEAEEVKRKKVDEANLAYKKMKDQMAELHKVKRV
jgi:hypothetical protein